MLAGRNLNFEFLFALFERLLRHLFVGLDAGLALGLAGAGREANPFQFALQRLLAGAGLLFLHSQPGFLLLQPRRVVAFPGNAAAAIEFQNPLGDVVEKIAIVRHGDDRAGILGQMPLQPIDAFGIEMVGRLVEQQQVGLFQQHLAQRHAAPLAAGELRHVGIARRQVHGIHGDFDLPIELPGVVQFDLILHFRLLGQQLFHFVGIDRLAQAGVDFVVAAQNCPHWPTASSTLPRTSLAGFSRGSCDR